jgi:hypothetical protein
LDELKVALGEDGNVSLDDKELRAGDLHQLTSGSAAEACVFGTYRCMAENCMGSANSEATLIGIGKY